MTTHRWTLDEVQTVVAMRAEGREYRAIAEHLGMTDRQVQHKASRSGITKTRGRLWTEIEIAYLCAMKKSGLSLQRIALTLERSENAVCIKWSRDSKNRQAFVRRLA